MSCSASLDKADERFHEGTTRASGKAQVCMSQVWNNFWQLFPKEIWALNRKEPTSALSYRCLSESVSEVKKTGWKFTKKKSGSFRRQILGLIGKWSVLRFHGTLSDRGTLCLRVPRQARPKNRLSKSVGCDCFFTLDGNEKESRLKTVLREFFEGLLENYGFFDFKGLSVIFV